jgi:hypothetical protein
LVVMVRSRSWCSMLMVVARLWRLVVVVTCTHP